MNSSDRDTDEANSKKKITWYTQHFYGRVVERSISQRLATEGHWKWRFNYCKMLPDHCQKYKLGYNVTGI